MQRVVVTGLGFVSSLGQTVEEVSTALAEGRSGVVRCEERVERGFRSPLTGTLRDYDSKRHLHRRERRSMSEPAQYAAVAALAALRDAELNRDALKGYRNGVVLGNDSTCGGAASAAMRTIEEGTTRKLGSSAVLDCMNSSPSINLSVLLGSQGACWTMSAACASGAHALGQGWSLIATGQQDVVVCGGTQELNWASMAGFDALGAFSTHDGDPANAVRPFSVDRDGLVPSGGAAVIILESLAHAQRRDARVRAELLSYAFTSDGHHVTTPNGAGAARCIQSAIDAAGISPSEIEYLNAHAAGTVLGDAAEARAILSVFGERCPPVSSTKSLTGHECWMAGASEAAYTILMSNGEFLAPNRNFSASDKGLEALNVVAQPTQAQTRMVMSNSFGFGGTNACLVFDTSAFQSGAVHV